MAILVSCVIGFIKQQQNQTLFSMKNIITLGLAVQHMNCVGT
jgi:hypothetical protein